MWTSRIVTWRPPYRTFTIKTGDEEVLYADADESFDLSETLANYAILDKPNTFTSDQNTFQTIRVQQVLTTSDRRLKRDIQPLSPEEAQRLVQSVQTYRFTYPDGRQAAGFMADEIPAAFQQPDPSPDAYMAVDYTSLLAHLWATVQQLQGRVDALTKKQKKKEVAMDPSKNCLLLLTVAVLFACLVVSLSRCGGGVSAEGYTDVVVDRRAWRKPLVCGDGADDKTDKEEEEEEGKQNKKSPPKRKCVNCSPNRLRGS